MQYKLTQQNNKMQCVFFYNNIEAVSYPIPC